MSQGTVKITADVEKYEPTSDCTFDVAIVRSDVRAQLYFYGYTDTWRKFGEQLAAFPLHIEDCLTFKIGDDESDCPLLAITAYCYDAQGHAALRILTDNKETDPKRCKLEFSILAEVASINQLGSSLLSWKVENGSEIIWQAKIS